MNVYNTKYPQLSGSSYNEVLKRARQEYNVIAHSTKRQPYIKSKYFSGEKVFLAVFWTHLMDKNQKDRTKRLRFYKAALDLLRNSQINPDTIASAEDQRMLLVGNVNSDFQDLHRLAIRTDGRCDVFLPIPNSASRDHCH